MGYHANQRLMFSLKLHLCKRNHEWPLFSCYMVIKGNKFLCCLAKIGQCLRQQYTAQLVNTAMFYNSYSIRGLFNLPSKTLKLHSRLVPKNLNKNQEHALLFCHCSYRHQSSPSASKSSQLWF